MSSWQRVGKYRWNRGEYSIDAARVIGTWVYTVSRGKTLLGSELNPDSARQLVEDDMIGKSD